MRRLITFLVVLALLLVVADRVACWVAERAIAQEVQKSENLTTRPDVDVAGFPFLTQALKGRYQQIDVTLDDPEVDGGLKIDSLDVRLRGVRVATGDLISGSVSSVPVDAATANARVSFAALNAAAKQNLGNDASKVEFGRAGADELAVKGSYSSTGLSVQLDLKVKLSVSDGDLAVELDPAVLDGLPPALQPEIRSMVTKALVLPSLPFGFKARSVTVDSTGITIQATSSTLNLTR